MRARRACRRCKRARRTSISSDFFFAAASRALLASAAGLTFGNSCTMEILSSTAFISFSQPTRHDAGSNVFFQRVPFHFTSYTHLGAPPGRHPRWARLPVSFSASHSAPRALIGRASGGGVAAFLLRAMKSEVDFSGDLSSGSCGTKVVYLSGTGKGITTHRLVD